MTYKVGDIIATKTYGSRMYLSQIQDIEEFENGDGYVLICQDLFDSTLKQCDKATFSILIPAQEECILSTKEFYDRVQLMIDNEQQLLDRIKERYDN